MSISHLIRFARACFSVDGFIKRNQIITEKLLKQGIDIINFEKHSPSFIIEISQYKCNFKALLRLGISHPEFYGDVIYKLRKMFGHENFKTLFPKRIKRFLKWVMTLIYYNALHS